jgi:hypothetical protein
MYIASYDGWFRNSSNPFHLFHPEPSVPNNLLDKSTCLKLVCKDVFEAGRLEETFERQETDIAIMNMTHSEFGDLFAAQAYGEDNHGYELIDVLDEALNAAKQEKW